MYARRIVRTRPVAGVAGPLPQSVPYYGKPFESLSLQEEYRMTGKLSDESISALLDAPPPVKHDDIVPHVQEAMAQFPTEDFLSSIIGRLHELHKNLRGGNRETMQGIIEALDDVAQCTFNAADYGRSELREIVKTMEAQS